MLVEHQMPKATKYFVAFLAVYADAVEEARVQPAQDGEGTAGKCSGTIWVCTSITLNARLLDDNEAVLRCCEAG